MITKKINVEFQKFESNLFKRSKFAKVSEIEESDKRIKWI